MAERLLLVEFLLAAQLAAMLSLAPRFAGVVPRTASRMNLCEKDMANVLWRSEDDA